MRSSLFIMSFICTAMIFMVTSANAQKINEERETDGDGAAGKINAVRGTSSGIKKASYKPAPAGYSLANVTTWANAHRAANPGFQYVYVPPEQVPDKEMSNTLRIAAAKAFNHLHWKNNVIMPVDVSDGHGLVFALNVNEAWGADAAANWGFIANCAAKSNIRISPAPRGLCQAFPAAEPVGIPRFVFNAVNGGPYANIHKTPTSYSAFARKFKLGSIKFTSAHKEAIVCGPRITAYRPVDYNGQVLVYSFSSDEFYGRDNGDIRYTNAPTDRDQRSTGALNAAPGNGSTSIASEWWMTLPNGFLYWGIHGEGSQERGKAEFPFAIDPANWRQGNELTTGRSCITCHVNGIHAAKSDDAQAGKNGWTSNEVLTEFYKPILEKFRNNMVKIAETLSEDEGVNNRVAAGTIEPVSKAIMVIEGPYKGGNNCSFFCNGKYGPRRQNLCETLPTR